MNDYQFRQMNRAYDDRLLNKQLKRKEAEDREDIQDIEEPYDFDSDEICI